MIVLRPLIMVIDDDESVRESLPDLLAELGYSARSFPSAEAFLSSDCIGTARCLILDMAMPGMSGLELQRELVQRGSHIPIVFITASTDETIRAHALAGGAVDCLFKPFSEGALLAALDVAFH